jgi:polar amino acid transport system substrate-binding protein
MRRQVLVLLFLIVFATTIIPYASAQAPLTIITEDWAPYNYMDNGVVKGFSVEIAQYIMKELKINSEIQLLPSARIRPILDAGPRVIQFTMLRTPERESLYKWIGPIGEDSIYFFKKSDSTLNIRTLDDAKKVKLISCRASGLVFKTLTDAGFTNLDTSTNSNGIYQKLVSGRTELAVGETPLGVKYLLKKSGFPTNALEQTPVKLLESRLFIACSKDMPDADVALWQKAFDKMKLSGVYNQLYQNYIQ